MTNQELFELMDRFSASGLTGLRLTQKDVSLELTRNGGAAPAAPAAACAPAGPEPAGKVLSAPLVGTYYAASAPDAVPFVTAGAQVSEGQTVCLIEAMKMMNEITTPAPGIVVEVLAANGTQVEYDQPLFRVATAAGETH